MRAIDSGRGAVFLASDVQRRGTLLRMPYRHLLMDLAGVVCRFDRSVRIAALADLAGADPASVEQRIYGSGLSDRFDQGEFSSPAMCDLLRERLHITTGDAVLAGCWATAFTPDDVVLGVVDRIRPDVTRSLLTNNDALLRDHLAHVLPTVHARFSLALFSSLLRATKPQPAAYSQALTLLGAAPGDAFFVDDSEANVDGARQVGMEAVRFTTAADLERDLTAAGLLMHSAREEQ